MQSFDESPANLEPGQPLRVAADMGLRTHPSSSAPLSTAACPGCFASHARASPFRSPPDTGLRGLRRPALDRKMIDRQQRDEANSSSNLQTNSPRRCPTVGIYQV